MKRNLFLMIILVLTMMLSAALAEEALSPLTRLYQAEQELLFATDNVTMSGHAVFSIDGQVFKTADLMHVQDGITSSREWLLLTPAQDGSERETGYSVRTEGGNVYAYESYGHGRKTYIVEPSLQRTGILRRTVTGDTLTEMAGLILQQCEGFGSQAAVKDEHGNTLITLEIDEKDIPQIVQALLNSVLQYGINRYTGGYNYADQMSTMDYGHYTYYGTISQGLMYCMRSVRLQQLKLDAVLDDEEHIREVNCSVEMEYAEKNGTFAGKLQAEFRQQAYDYGSSTVPNELRWDEPVDCSCP